MFTLFWVFCMYDAMHKITGFRTINISLYIVRVLTYKGHKNTGHQGSKNKPHHNEQSTESMV